MSPTATSIGICIGASTVSVVRLASAPRLEGPGPARKPAPCIAQAILQPHGGNPRHAVIAALEQIDLPPEVRIAATGRKFRHFLNLPSITEPEAVEQAYAWVKPEGINCPGIISAGGETFMAYKLNDRGRIINVYTGNKCAAGTGEFFLQQLRRLDASLEDAAQWAETTPPYKVSGRCAVFCKSDCTHATNKGIAKERVASGLGQMMADKIIELLRHVDHRNLMLTGGTSRNRMMIAHLRKKLPGLIIPEAAAFFEALGAALWAAGRPPCPMPRPVGLFHSQTGGFNTLPGLETFRPQVSVKTLQAADIKAGDVCLLGLDVGSTTTKAVLLRRRDRALLASVYLRTNGDPVRAARRCYRSIEAQLLPRVRPADITIAGLGVCGSGRHIAGLHAMTQGILNEITAHATAAVYFDPRVDTIFEIGGQDAKYTHITNGVPSDYAMNEACSAGTGSFLEEAARETMGIAMEDLAAVALQGRRPPNFNDQCAAFIASDIKNAIHEGLCQEDIAAGLVYSICMNYSNRVKGHRPVGRNVFMQGGVCYNTAVPLAMAGLIDKRITVPPEPGLMGAFGAALEVGNRLDSGILAEDRFDLSELSRRSITYGRPFTCNGGASGCDRRCEISRMTIDGRTYPFGGACNRYENLRRGRPVASEDYNWVRRRQQMVFQTHTPGPMGTPSPGGRGRIGLNRSFMVNTYYPLYANFFHALGFETILPERTNAAGIEMRNAPFCFPAELAHGFFFDLISGGRDMDYLFLPHFKSVPPINGERTTQLCPLVQGEPFYLKTTFREQIYSLGLSEKQILTPRLDLSRGIRAAKPAMVDMARRMGIPKAEASRAFDHARACLGHCMQDMAARGNDAMRRLESNPDRIGMVLLARPYNGYAVEAHMGIPDKFASRGITVIPFDFLNYRGQPSTPSMYWGMGQRMLMAARTVQAHPQLFATYITNFSCGPDSFILNYFRHIMGAKPSLTLELDSHSADAGIETRIDAFLDIIAAWRRIGQRPVRTVHHDPFVPARIVTSAGLPAVRTSDGNTVPLTDPRISFVLPSMGELGTQALAAAFRSVGFNAMALPPSEETDLKTGRGMTSCKECLPLILTTGALMNHIRNHKAAGDIVVYFMPGGSGPCRFGQYRIFMENLLKKLRIPDVALFSLSSDTGYDEIPGPAHRRGWQAVVISDVFEDMRSMLLVNARRPDDAMDRFHELYGAVLHAIETGDARHLHRTLMHTAAELAAIPLHRPARDVPVITLAGEIFVRRDGLSRQHITEYLAGQGFATACAPVAEWIRYSDAVTRRGWSGYRRQGLKPRLKARIKQWVMYSDEKRIKSLLSHSGLVHSGPVALERIIDTARPYISPHLCGEAILTIGSTLKEIVSETCGAIAIGPFGCMPNRLSEAILMEAMKKEDKAAASPGNRRLQSILESCDDLPFLAIESDGLAFPQQTQAKLEAFCLRAERLHRRMRQAR